ncbi:MAG: DNA methyltransferase [Anaerolineae bacterium]
MSSSTRRVAEARPVYANDCRIVQRKAIERSFPFVELSEIAERESWRKDVYQPVYYIHKWWARRLSCVFRGIVLGACTPAEGATDRGADGLLDLFYRPVQFPNMVVYDPFMGSGTTVGEAHKLGCRVIGRDINPVSYFIVKNALSTHDVSQVRQAFKGIESDVSRRIKGYYKARTEHHGLVDVLYYFWVKFVPCPSCGTQVDLFNSRIFAKHARPSKQAKAKSLCPACEAINSVTVYQTEAQCDRCGTSYNPQEGSADRAKARCPACQSTFPIIEAVSFLDHPPDHRMYAKVILKPDGSKEYLSIDEYDRALYRKASTELQTGNFRYPQVAIEPGYNTNQVLNYHYAHWHQMFNDRQLLCLSILSERIRHVEQDSLRALFACLLSGCLEFNSMFCSFKGEGTGAVRHTFSHHILKPERMPLEANLWGTPESSGAFSTLFERRILRAIEYKGNPFELQLSGRVNGKRQSKKVFNLSRKMGGGIASTYDEFRRSDFDIYLSCGGSSQTDIEDGVVDAVVTDPPFFDNVHYSQLADFFYVWIREMMGHEGVFQRKTTRSTEEVQQTDPGSFTDNLIAVFRDCHRVLKDDGLLIFTYHHSRPEGWSAILEAIHEAGFYVEATHPVKSEMSVSIPKQQAKSPIDIDIIIVGRELALVEPFEKVPAGLLDECVEETSGIVEAFNRSNKKLSRNDITVIMMARLITTLSRVRDLKKMLVYLDTVEEEIGTVVRRIWEQQNPQASLVEARQMRLF